MKIKTLIWLLQQLDPELEVVSGTMRPVWNRYHTPLLGVHKKGQRDDLRGIISKELPKEDLEGFVIL